MIAFPPCKINLGLHVTEKRNDGFHNLETCFYPLPFEDILEIIPSDVFSFTSSGLVIEGPADQNLCIRAYELLRKDFSLTPVKIHLHKIIPTGAGLGGGSSDAAHTLRLLNSIFELQLPTEQLKHYAAQLGSDCAFFIQDIPQLGFGRGELLEPIHVSLKGYYLVLVKPPIHVSTVEAYKGIIPAHPVHPLKRILVQSPINEWKHVLKNDFEVSVFKNHPAIQQCKEQLYEKGALYAAMSGSGAAVFGIFEKPITTEFTNLLWKGTLTL